MNLSKQARTRWGVLSCFLFLWIGAFAIPKGSADDYVGVKKCRVCHLAEAKSWEKTKMAKAFGLLKPGVAEEAKKSKNLDPEKDYTNDTKCLECHTTGYGKGGFQSVEATPELAGVTCEARHGPGGGYLKPDLMV